MKFIDITLLKQLTIVLSKKEKKKIVVLIILMLCVTFFELLGIGVIVPILVYIGQPHYFEQYSITIFDELISSYQPLIILQYAGIFLLLIFVAKSLLTIYVQNYKFRMIWDKNISLSNKLFKSYINKPYSFHTHTNSAILIRNINNQVGAFIMNLLTPTLDIIASSIMLMILVGVLFYSNFIESLIISSLMFINTFIFIKLIKNKIVYYGQETVYHSGMLNKHILQGFGGIKELKILAKEKYFINAFNDHNIKNSSAHRFKNVINQIPRLLLEIALVVAIIITMIVKLQMEVPQTEIFIDLSILVVIGVRLMPLVGVITSSIATIKFGMPSLDIVIKEFSDLSNGNNMVETIKSDNQSNKLDIKDIITFDNVTYQYNKSEKMTIKGISFLIKKNNIIGFVGSSGAGKTTLIDLLLGLINPTEGEVLVDGVNINENIKAWQVGIGYIPQNIFLTDETIRENIAFGIEKKYINEELIVSSLESAQLSEFVRNLPNKLDTKVGERGMRLSGGQRQRIGIARALYRDPPLIVMDEATASLDNKTESEVLKAIRSLSKDKTIIMIAHRLSTVKICDNIYFMDNGRIIDSGTYENLLAKNVKFRNLANVGEIDI
jgi:ATP-binding cassette, subfamily B, bacterial PglK